MSPPKRGFRNAGGGVVLLGSEAKSAEGKALQMHKQFRPLVLFAVAVSALVVAQAVPSATTIDSAELREAVTVEGILEHEEAFQAIADANEGTRAAGTSGYDASLDYVRSQLDPSYFTITEQEFDFPFFEELATPEFERVSPQPRDYVVEDDFFTMDYSGSGEVTGTLVATNDIILDPVPSRARRTVAARRRTLSRLRRPRTRSR